MKSFHNRWHTVIKNRLKASFVAWERTGDNYYLKIIKDGIAKYAKVEGSPSDVSPQNYMSLLSQLEEEYNGSKV